MYSKVFEVCCLLLVVLIVSVSASEEERFFRSLFSCAADAKEEWSYRGKNGPPYWGEKYPTCYGDKQSPIAINTRTAVPNNDLEKLELRNYDQPLTSAKIENNGHTIQVTPTDGVNRSIVVEGSTYNLAQFHFHWGDVYYKGAEHTIDGIQYANELHFVHLDSNSNIAVVGVFFTEQDTTNANLEPIVETFSKVLFKGTETNLASSVNLNMLLPENPASYYRYDGSLTTPDCSEGVKWSVLPRPLPVSRLQMKQFRRLYTVKKQDASHSCHMVNNYRPVQPLNDRTVYSSR